MATPVTSTAAAFSGLVELASERLGGKTLAASDEFFAEKENLLKPGRGVFIPDKYTDRGKWMDGWESRRKRTPGFDWCIIRLGLPGIIHGVDIDTNHFLGNNPAYASIEACFVEQNVSVEELNSKIAWTEIMPRSPLLPGSQNIFVVADRKQWNVIRLNIYPDGGVARLRVYGNVVPQNSEHGKTIDLAAIENGGKAVACSDMFFSSMANLIMPGRALNMGDGWETKRRRGPGYDWAVIQLGKPGRITKIEVDTNHFKGNFPDTCSIDGCHAPGKNIDTLTWPDFTWKELLPNVKLSADKQHFFEKELSTELLCSHIRINIYPDGGISRLRVWGL